MSDKGPWSVVLLTERFLLWATARTSLTDSQREAAIFHDKDEAKRVAEEIENRPRGPEAVVRVVRTRERLGALAVLPDDEATDLGVSP